MASGAAGNQFDIAGTLSLSLDALVTVLNASVIAGVALATYSKVSTTTLRAIYDTAGEAGNMFTITAFGSAAAPVIANKRLTGGAAVELLAPGYETYNLVVNGGSNSAVVLPAGEDAQEVTLFLKTKGGAGSVVVTPSAIAGGTTLTFDTVGELSKLKWLGGSWRVLANTGALA